MEEEHQLSDLSFFLRGQEKSNAGPLLNSRVPWRTSHSGDQGGPDLDARQIAADEKLLSLPATTRGLLKRWGKSFPEHHSELRYDAFDFGWMEEALAYDYWDITEASPIEDMFAKGMPTGAFLSEHPQPDFLLLLDLAKVRLMKGMFEGALDEAVTETYHLARLSYSTEDLAGALTAVGIFQAQRDIQDHLNRHIHLKIADIEPLPEATLLMARRAIQSMAGLFSLITPEETLKKVFDDPQATVGLCSALSEGMLRALITRPLLVPRVPLERDYAPAFEALDMEIQRNIGRCRIKQLKALWDKGGPSPWEGIFQPDNWRWAKWDLFQFVPWFRKGLGITMVSVFLPKPFPGYEKDPEPK